MELVFMKKKSWFRAIVTNANDGGSSPGIQCKHKALIETDKNLYIEK